MAIISISNDGTNYTALPDPAELQVSLQDIDASTTTRSADGTLLRDRVCGGASAKRKLQIKWSYKDASTTSSILQAFGAEFFYVKYPDPWTGAERAAYMYAGDRSVPMYHHNLRNGGYLWESISVDFIEQ